jgi:hypothetical protein
MVLEALKRLGATSGHAPAIRHEIGTAIGLDRGKLLIGRLR